MGNAMTSNGAKKTASEERREMWYTRLEMYNGTLPGDDIKASLLSRLSFSWIGPLVQLAYARPLEPQHLSSLPASSKTAGLLERFESAWGEQLAKPKGRRSLARAMAKVFRRALIVTAVLELARQVALLAVPLLLRQLLKWLIDEDSDDTYVGVLWAAALFFVEFCGNGLLSNQFFMFVFVLGMDARTMLNGFTYAKSLRLSNKARQGISTGELVTLMSNDAQRLTDMSISVHAIWSSPLSIAVALYLLIDLVGVAALGGILFLVCMIAIQGKIAKKQMGLQRAQMKQTESRIKVVNEVLQGIRIVKYYAWEAPFMDRINNLRELEIQQIRDFAFANACTFTIMQTTPFVMTMLTLVVFFNMDGDFSPDVVFTAVSLLLVVRLPLNMLPMAIAAWVQGKVSVGRLQTFLELEELQTTDREWTNCSGNGMGAGALSVSGRFVWTPPDDGDDGHEEIEAIGINSKKGKEVGEVAAARKPPKKAMAMSSVDGGIGSDDGEGQSNELLKDGSREEVWDLQVNDIHIPAGKLAAVVGQVGSGKSSLVSALLGEMTKIDGRVSIDGSVAYVAQSAWIINASLRDNILMDRPFNEDRYQKVLEVCELKQDLSQLPAGDDTEIGEKGINLSGGQKQRVSIARAAYANADVYILDDPLSAVDAHVARHLFDECLARFLKGKTIILCTNQLQFLPRTDRVFVVHEGRIVEEGAYSELIMRESGGLAKLMEAFVDDSDEEVDLDKAPGGTQMSNEGYKSDLRGYAVTRLDMCARRATVAITPAGRKRQSRNCSPGTGHHESGVPGTPWSKGVGTPTSADRQQAVPTPSYTNDGPESMETRTPTVGEASDATASMVTVFTAGSLVPLSATLPDTRLEERLQDTGFDDEEEKEDGGEGARPSDHSRNCAESALAKRSRDSRIIPARQSSDVRASSAASRNMSDAVPGGQGAINSTSIGAQEAHNARGALQTTEKREEGAVDLRVFKIYFRDGTGGWFLPIMVVIVSVLTQAASNTFDYWLSYWSGKFLDDGADKDWYQYVYAGLCIALVSFNLTRALLLAVQALKSSRHLHSTLLKGIMRAPVSFFDTTPVGRVLNRFTKDMDSIDLQLPRNVPQFVATMSVLIGVGTTIVIVLPWFLLIIIPVGFCYYRVQMYYRPVNRDLQRLESVSRSPIFAQFSETLNGVSTLRAYNQQAQFVDRNSALLDDSSRAFYHMQVSNRWLGVRLEAMGTSLTLTAALLIVLSKGSDTLNIEGGVAGLVLTYTQQITGMLSWGVRMGCETEARITAAERAQEYADLKPEALPVVEDYRPPKGWPASGAVNFSGIKMRYRPGLDLVLKNVSLNVKGGEHIGIAGRTGSGKSSLMVALFRIVEPAAGSITIDGVDALRVGLQDLREAISIIPQDPVMFCGTIRENLDPFGRSDDVTIWAALEAARLSQYVSSLEGKLEAEVSEGGENLSLGQRQLVCLARAVLRRNKILVMDEATANVDVETDSLIQEAIRKEFSGCTVFTIAHRLNTIMDSDRILVMEKGKVGEFDTPASLVTNEQSLLMGLISEMGPGSSRRLVSIGNNAVAQAVAAEDDNSYHKENDSDPAAITNNDGSNNAPLAIPPAATRDDIEKAFVAVSCVTDDAYDSAASRVEMKTSTKMATPASSSSVMVGDHGAVVRSCDDQAEE